MNYEEIVKEQREHCLDQVSITEDRELTVWALGGFAPTDRLEIPEFFNSSPPYHKTFAPALSWDSIRVQQFIHAENEYRILLVQSMNKFIADLRATRGMVSKASRASGIPRGKLDKLRFRLEAFDELWYEVEEEVTDELEEAVLSRAIDGVPEPVYHQGVKCGTKQKYSDSLASMALQGRRPDKYKQKSTQELTGPDGGPLQSESTAVNIYIPDNGRD